MAKRIPLSTTKVKGLYALVDDEDYERLSQWNWTAIYTNRKNGGYAVRVQYGTTYLMHRVVLGVGDDVSVKHLNRNGLDNRRENLKEIKPKVTVQNG
jgi:hypothetical protein